METCYLKKFSLKNKGSYLLDSLKSKYGYQTEQSPKPLNVLKISTNTWLDHNAKALASVKCGLKDAASNKTHYLGSFAAFADLEIDEEEED